MTTFNPLSDTYATRRNVPLPDVTDHDSIRRSYAWTLKAFLKNELSTGTLSGTRASGSVWTHVASSDGTQHSTVTDLWGATFDASKLVFGTGSPSPMSWIVLDNAALGYQLCICFILNYNNVSFSFTPSGTPFGSFSHTTRPSATNAFYIRPGDADGWNNYLADYVAGGNYYAHFVTNATDGQFWFLVNRSGTGIFNHFMAVQKTVDVDPSDTRNVFALGHSSNNGRGAMNSANVGGAVDSYFQNPNTIFGQHKAGTAWGYNEAGVGPRALFGGSFNYAGNYGIDNTTGLYNAFPVGAMSINPVAWRGRFPDWYQIGTAQVGAGIPLAGPSQERIVVGDAVIPFVGGSPNL